MTTSQAEPETVTVPASTLADLRDANTLLRRRERAMRELIATHIAQGLDSRDGDRWRAAITLTQALDNADCNVDQLVDQWLEDHGWDPRAAYKALPTGAPADDPWAEAEKVAAREPWGPASPATRPWPTSSPSTSPKRSSTASPKPSAPGPAASPTS
ncbi:hypothetical protein KEF29_03550 [Streptomyces tuirus]|uniref:Uncharacterized protein n=1 Tax=Streptomyces tuirus TaxID=68278 RepID=A0A941FEW3_9ACTN|nr:hypothetical protein [Streptomyces tuirus]